MLQINWKYSRKFHLICFIHWILKNPFYFFFQFREVILNYKRFKIILIFVSKIFLILRKILDTVTIIPKYENKNKYTFIKDRVCWDIYRNT